VSISSMTIGLHASSAAVFVAVKTTVCAVFFSCKKKRAFLPKMMHSSLSRSTIARLV